jgi:membrane-associated protease RseP (regulator of RpoE activity)
MMKMKNAVVAAVVALGAVTMVGQPLSGQAGVGGQTYCPEGLVQGDLGISGHSCEGECTLTIRRDGSERFWSFTTEPNVIGLRPGGPADGILRVGDRLVAIDGILITTREGGRRYANLQPGEAVSVRYRRDGRVREASIQVGSRCLDPPEPVPAVGRVAPPRPVAPEPVTGVVVAPRVVVTPAPSVAAATAVEGEPVVAPSVARRATAGLFGTEPPTGKLGVGFSCAECGTQTDADTGETVWFFSGPLEVTAVTAGGPADDAGVQRGDLIKAIDGKDLTTDEGGLAFSRLTPGEDVQLTIVGRDGSERRVAVVPDEGSSRRILSGRARARTASSVGVAPDEPRRPLGTVRRAPPEPSAVVVPDRVTQPAPVVEPPAGLPLRYSGGVAGVEVEVRGEPVSVSEMRGARTLIINAEGVWIRIVVPRGRGVGLGALPSPGGVGSSESGSTGSASGIGG